jgi:hypothetical protein
MIAFLILLRHPLDSRENGPNGVSPIVWSGSKRALTQTKEYLWQPIEQDGVCETSDMFDL